MDTHKDYGLNVDEYDAHIFHIDNKEIWEYINQFTESNGYFN